MSSIASETEEAVLSDDGSSKSKSRASEAVFDGGKAMVDCLEGVGRACDAAVESCGAFDGGALLSFDA